jgi:hypothetical protein
MESQIILKDFGSKLTKWPKQDIMVQKKIVSADGKTQNQRQL